MQENQSPSKRIYFELFLISFLVLFFELACIRWFAAYVVFLTFFTNVILLASFLGMSVGCLAAARKPTYLLIAPALVLLAVASAIILLQVYKTNAAFMVDVGNQNSPQLVYFGTESRHADISKFVIPMEVIAGYFFLFVALIFVGIGQVMGRRFDMVPNRIYAYTTNIFGSLVGIAAFALISILWLPPVVWFLVAFACIGYFLLQQRKWLVVNAICMALTILVITFSSLGQATQKVSELFAPENRTVPKQAVHYWSPYYWITFFPTDGTINTNNLGHQQMKAVGSKGVAYALPYLLSRDSHRPPIKDVLIIGAGSGNDVANSLWAGAERVDAVEIDPVIYDIGKRQHPNQPYQDPRVHVHLNDGRNFLKETDQKYDLVVYALVDSLILHSGYSSLRLENYLFTEQAFKDIKARLKDGGIFVMYNYFRQGWIVARLQQLVRDAIGSEPIVLSLPYRPVIPVEAPPGNEQSFTMFITGDIEKIADQFKNNTSYWIKKTDFLKDSSASAFGATPPAALGPADGLEQIGPAIIEKAEAARFVPNDNWPFLYLKGHVLPSQTVRGMIVIGFLSFVLLMIFAPVKTIRFNWTMFFLGAGFMLLETKSVVHLALLFGSTWIVNSIVFFAILVMILLANLYILRAKPQRLAFFYVALVLSLIANVFFNINAFLGLPEMVRIVGSCFIVFLPIFFAGVIFAAYFRESANPDMDLGSNIAGVVLGGLAENFSMVLGFNHILWIAIGFYLLSRLLKGRALRQPVPMI